MKYLKVGAIAIAAWVSTAMAGDKVGGGGAAVVCRNTSGQISSVKLLDLYQAEVERHLTIPRSTQPRNTQIAKALGFLNPSLAFDIKQRIAKIKVDLLPTNITMHQQYDLGSNPVQIEDNCTPEWVAYYGEDNHLKIVTKYYNKMSITDQAALYVHEGVYKITRDYDGETDSARARQIVGNIFSSAPNSYELKDLTQTLVREEYKEEYSCGNGLEVTLSKSMTSLDVYQLSYRVQLDNNEDSLMDHLNANFYSTLTRSQGRYRGNLKVKIARNVQSRILEQLETTFVEFRSQDDSIQLRMPLVSGRYLVKENKPGQSWPVHIEPQWETFAWDPNVAIVACKVKRASPSDKDSARRPLLF